MKIVKETIDFQTFLDKYSDNIEKKIGDITDSDKIDPDEYNNLAKGLYKDYEEFGDIIFDEEEY